MAPDPRRQLSKLDEFKVPTLEEYYAEQIERRERQQALQREAAARVKLYSFDVTLQAHTLDKQLPRDLTLIKEILNDPKESLERRAKLLEVVIFRGASNDLAYAQMSKAAVEDLDDAARYLKREKEFTERRACQEIALGAVFTTPALFDQLSKSKDALPQGRSPATEFLFTTLRNGGIYGSHEARQGFEKQLLQMPPETRGRMMYHMLDAGQTSDIHLKGERRTTGYGWEVSIDTGKGGLGVGYSTQWEYMADNHWRAVGRDVTREMRADLATRSSDYVQAHDEGFKDAAKRDKGFSD